MSALIESRPYPLTRWHLSQPQIESLRMRLLERRLDALNQIDRLREVIHDDSDHLTDDPDRRHLQLEEDHEVTASLLDREQTIFEAIERALWRLDNGTYGFCVQTGLPIPIERLDAVPWAERLADVQDVVDRIETAVSGNPD